MIRASALLVLALSSLAPSAAIAQDTTGFDRTVVERCRTEAFNGVVVLAVAGRAISTHSCGTGAQTGSRFRLLSASKMITSLAIMKLVEEGHLGLDEPVARYIPDLPVGWKAVTVRHLLQQTSSIHNHTNELSEYFTTDRNAAMRRLLKQREIRGEGVRQTPGTRYRYNDFGFELLVDAAERVTGLSWSRILQSRVFDPAGMTGSRLDRAVGRGGNLTPAPDALMAEGWRMEQGVRVRATPRAFTLPGSQGIATTAADLIALDRALARHRIVRSATWATMTTGSVLMNPEDPNSGLGLGVMVGPSGGLDSHGHNGGLDGYISVFRRFPAQDAVVIGLFNSDWTGARWLEDAAATELNLY